MASRVLRIPVLGIGSGTSQGEDSESGLTGKAVELVLSSSSSSFLPEPLRVGAVGEGFGG